MDVIIVVRCHAPKPLWNMCMAKKPSIWSIHDPFIDAVDHFVDMQQMIHDEAARRLKTRKISPEDRKLLKLIVTGAKKHLRP